MKDIPYTSRWIDIGNRDELHIIECGTGRPLVFIPGLTFPGKIFEQQLAAFSKHYRVIALDPRGQGLSSKTLNGNDYLTHGRDLAAAIAALDLKNVVLIGWSTGNLTVWSYLKQFGYTNVKGAVTIDMSPLPMSCDPNWWTEGSIPELTEIARDLLTSIAGCRAFFKEYAETVMIEHKMTEGELSYLLELSGITPDFICRQLFENAICSDFLETAKQAPLKIPTLMFIAKHWADIAVPFCERELAGTPTEVLGGHLMFYEYADEWNALFSNWLEKNNL